MYYLLSLILGLSILQIDEHNISISFTDLPSPDGKIALAIYTPDDDFLSNAPYRSVIIDVTDEFPKIETTLPKGKYAISLYHDANSNDKLDKSLIGLPVEGYGFSNNVMGLFGPPSFDKASVIIQADTALVINFNH